MTSISRRTALKLGFAAGAAAFLPLASKRIALGSDTISAQIPGRFKFPLRVPPLANRLKRVTGNLITPYSQTDSFGGLVEPINVPFIYRDVYDMTMQKNRVQIPGINGTTEIWGYNGISPGPTFKVQKGAEVLARFKNLMDTPDALGNTIYTSVHLHGMAALPPFDGWANDISLPNEGKDYYYPNNRAATLWYHDHGVHRTTLNDYMGLGGMYLVEDLELEHPGLPRTYPTNPLSPGLTGDDIPLILADKIFDSYGNFVFDPDEVDNEGFHGDVILVNGVPWPVMEVQRKPYRLRILNTGVARAYNLYLSNGERLQVIGTGGGLLPSVQPTKRLRIGVAERYEVIIDFSNYSVGETVNLLNDELKNHPEFLHTNKIMQFKVVSSPRQPLDNNVLNNLRQDGFNFQQRIDALKAYGNQNFGGIPKRLMEFERKNGMWTINGNIWGNGVNPIEAKPKFGAVEIWRLKNSSGGWNHPIHIHLIDFLMLNRIDGRDPGVRNYEKGLKDTVYLGEGEEIDVIGIFAPHRGKYMFHCHNLPHEDHDMMRAIEVGTGGLEPVGTDGTLATRGQGPYDARPIAALPPL